MGLALAFESSCDETGVALVENGRRVIAAPLFSQIALHRPYGGIVPEYASRAHLEKFTSLLEQIQAEHALKPGDLDYVAVTTRPGLIGALLVGYQTARAAARYFGAPLIGVHHLEAHLAAIRLNGAELPYPALGLLLSGGNSAIYRLHAPGEITVIGDTLDDAAGEALDKAAQLIGLGYPGGPLIEKCAARFCERRGISRGNEAMPEAENMFPMILKSLRRDKVEFSFSGIKTALARYVAGQRQDLDADAVAFFYQERIVEHIARNVAHALEMHAGLPLIAAGGVLANQRLRQALETVSRKAGISLHVPDFAYCTDNAAMVAAAAQLYFENGIASPYVTVDANNGFLKA
ncbi:MAG: tRNA (adenosine(37)-N6)-threonylcarbamoyltransferase complex transferase subunit TsaD [Leptospiraceae bacterium]|nr:tRNA (adenosine(37)-N6)-threonylcarbamoyltransferase complex transferase subunit TsaD [Leptospiraceae bacterium]